MPRIVHFSAGVRIGPGETEFRDPVLENSRARLTVLLTNAACRRVMRQHCHGLNRPVMLTLRPQPEARRDGVMSTTLYPSAARSDAVYKNHVGGRRLETHRLERTVLLGVVPAPGLFGAGEL